MAAAGPAYSVLLPTYNERENIALIVALLVKTLEAECAALPSCRLLECCQTLLILGRSGLHSLARFQASAPAVPRQDLLRAHGRGARLSGAGGRSQGLGLRDNHRGRQQPSRHPGRGAAAAESVWRRAHRAAPAAPHRSPCLAHRCVSAVTARVSASRPHSQRPDGKVHARAAVAGTAREAGAG